jgi:hypothetical protein
LKKSIQSNDFKFSMKDITAISQGTLFAETVTNAIVWLHKYQAVQTTKLTTSQPIQSQPDSSLGEKKMPDVFVVRNYAAELVGNHPTSSFSLDSVLVSPKEDSFFKTAPTMPSLQPAIFEAATFRPCPLIVTNVEQSEWNTPHELQPQAEPPTQLRHTTTLSVHCVLKEGGSTQPTLRTAVLEGLYEWINDPL